MKLAYGFRHGNILHRRGSRWRWGRSERLSRLSRLSRLTRLKVRQQMIRRHDLEELHSSCRENCGQELDDGDDFLLGLILQRCEVFRHVAGKVNIVLCRLIGFALGEDFDHGAEELLARLPLLANEEVPPLEQSDGGWIGTEALNWARRDLLLVFEGLACANAEASVDEMRVLRVDDSVQRSCSVADLGARARLKGNDNRERLERVS